jgi:hypothetical protein
VLDNVTLCEELERAAAEQLLQDDSGQSEPR